MTVYFNSVLDPKRFAPSLRMSILIHSLILKDAHLIYA